MKCIDCQNAEMCLDHKEHPGLIGCTSGIPSRKKRANADRIRSMSDEELAELLDSVDNGGIRALDIDYPCDECTQKTKCDECFLEWLQSEVEE